MPIPRVRGGPVAERGACAGPPLFPGGARYPARPGPPTPLLRRVRRPGVFALRCAAGPRTPGIDAPGRHGSGPARSDPGAGAPSPLGSSGQRDNRGRSHWGLPPGARSRRTGAGFRQWRGRLDNRPIDAARFDAFETARDRVTERFVRTDPAAIPLDAAGVRFSGPGRRPYVHGSSGRQSQLDRCAVRDHIARARAVERTSKPEPDPGRSGPEAALGLAPRPGGDFSAGMPGSTKSPRARRPG